MALCPRCATVWTTRAGVIVSDRYVLHGECSRREIYSCAATTRPSQLSAIAAISGGVVADDAIRHRECAGRVDSATESSESSKRRAPESRRAAIAGRVSCNHDVVQR